MSILVLMDRFLPDNGGSINWMVNTYSRWSSEKIVFVVPQCERAEEVDSALPFTILRLPMGFPSWDPTLPKTFIEYARLVFQIQRICQQHEVRQIHCAKVLPEGLVAWWIHRLKGISYVLYAHGEEILFTQMSRKFSWLVPRVYNGAAVVIANSRNTESLLHRIGVTPKRIHVIHPGVEAKLFCDHSENPDRVRKQYGLGKSEVLLTVGRLQRRKGQDMVIRALPKVHKKFPGVKYVIVGQGEDRGYLEHVTRDVGVENSVVFVGRVENKDLQAFYAACDIFVMPNRQIGGDVEGFGMVFLEASAAGKPVIGGKSGGTNEAILDGKTGCRIDGESVDEIAGAILSLLSHPDDARRMGADGQKWVQHNCSWEAVVEKTQKVVFRIDE